MTESAEPEQRVLVGLCHDLNDRLASLQGMLHLAQHDGTLAAAPAAALQAELERLELLISRARRLAREPWRLEEALIVPELLEEVRELLSHHADRSRRSIWVHAPEYLPPVRADRSRLRAFLLQCASWTPDTEDAVVRCLHENDDVRLVFPVASLPDAATAAALAAQALEIGARCEVSEAPPQLDVRLTALRAGGASA